MAFSTQELIQTALASTINTTNTDHRNPDSVDNLRMRQFEREQRLNRSFDFLSPFAHNAAQFKVSFIAFEKRINSELNNFIDLINRNQLDLHEIRTVVGQLKDSLDFISFLDFPAKEKMQELVDKYLPK